MDLFNKINDLGLKLPKPPKPAGVYRPILIVDKYLFVSGQGPCLLYTSPSPRDGLLSRMPSSA